MQISVRKKALRKLMEVYRVYCSKCSEGCMTISDFFEQIPCKVLMLCYDKNCKEFRYAFSPFDTLNQTIVFCISHMYFLFYIL